ncbi:L-ascorbate oxidase homolog isoform X1 [Beta vulgaris subsp. vulgaris]|uniref:L-ascorbate oxidase homolog isoform X1 n=1 Tax=Beta vulgaris subsp. vulgaris TaxID=3555 RepID=UPI00053FF6BF|nr:L-ascorbate oxidase homolog isoform X1 [Beta vulgaris subsp. vulgaris]
MVIGSKILCLSTLKSLFLLLIVLVNHINGESPYRFFTLKVHYGIIYPMGVRQNVIMINGQFPGPQIDCVTNDNLVISVHNYLNEPFLLSWNGLQNRRNSYQDGMPGTTCPIPPRRNYTYVLQAKDQIGSFFYFPSINLHKASGGYGAIRIYSRPRIPVPFPPPAGDFTVLAGDWYKKSHRQLMHMLERGRNIRMPDGLLINGRGWNGYTFTVEQGRTYRFRISNVGISTSINFRIAGHRLKLVEVEGTHTMQSSYTSLDIHLGQSYSVLVTADQPPDDYYVVVSSRFTKPVLTTTAVLHYRNSWKKVSGPLPRGPTTQIGWSLNQAHSIRMNLTASGPRPNPQGSYHYGMIKLQRTIVLANSAAYINGRQRYAINSVSYVQADTPLKLADYFNIPGVYYSNSMPSSPSWRPAYQQTAVLQTDYRTFIEMVFQNQEDTVQSYHIDGYAFFVVGMDGGQWTPRSRASYNLRDAVTRSTVQVYPKAWTAVYMSLDNVGMWNIRSENWIRQYLGQQFYMRVYTNSHSWRDEYPIPKNALLCGRARGRHTRPM